MVRVSGAVSERSSVLADFRVLDGKGHIVAMCRASVRIFMVHDLPQLPLPLGRVAALPRPPRHVPEELVVIFNAGCHLLLQKTSAFFLSLFFF